ncbi:MAG: ATP-binding protein [Clostridiaceae bacterium]|nr:ATP-binding protein [Clostridiaceae bacterium]
MRRKHYFLRRFLLILVVGVLAALLALFTISTRLAIHAFDAISRSILERNLNQAESLALSYARGELTAEELDHLFNPELDTSLASYIFFSADGSLAAASKNAFNAIQLNTVRQQTADVAAEQFVILAEIDQDRVISQRMLAKPVYLNQKRCGLLLVGIDTGDLQIEQSRFKTNFFLAIWPLFLLVILASFIMANHWAKPIGILTDAARRISGGQINTRIAAPLPGEMGELAAAFNEMSASLNKTIQSLNYEKNSMGLMLEGLREGIMAIDASGNILHQNSAAMELTGGPDNPHYRRIIESLGQCVNSGEPGEGQLTVADTLIAYTVRRIPSGDRTRGGAIALLRDITASERLEQTRRDYVANISHELRTPLTAMRSLIEPLRDGLVETDEDCQRCYAMIASETVRLSNLVDDLLELSGLQSGSASFEMERIDTGDLMQDIYYRNLILYQKADLTFTLKLPDDMPAIRSNEDRLVEVLTIFLDNARKYTPAGGTVELSAFSVGKAVAITVRDTGIGMDETDLKYAFDRFYQGDRSRSDRGNGLGLAIAREILDKLAVPLQVESKPGQGSTFTLHIPVDTENSGQRQ